MVQTRKRNWCRKYLRENGPSTTQEILEYIEKKTTGLGGGTSNRSLGMIMKCDSMIRKIDKVTLTGETGVTYSVNLWAIKEE
tara:strand:+ start:1136 stop:1381 length:246 start_codon:yes stop_codon:yes gene_type:complete